LKEAKLIMEKRSRKNLKKEMIEEKDYLHIIRKSLKDEIEVVQKVSRDEFAALEKRVSLLEAKLNKLK
jgi:BMFP domain-containing protein YqiC